MPKMKTNRSAAKRFKVTATGKILHKPSGKRHLLRKKSSKTKRALSKYKELFKGYYHHVAKVLGDKL
ncbi:MAG: 50S ribosomal protein L35 [Caldimicrobium sp.]|nr:50S ribosomal protein L35 [Caldimicrobium sp.]MCX7874439.1 50S ribosomal protein L35 [Caldimicrobium sp.]MDW8094952.1 50S ribosomal protein L35 [Caldimicrobium sp.]